MRTLFVAAFVLLMGAPLAAQGFYARGDVHGTLSRCADASLDLAGPWADCDDAHGEPGIGLNLEAGYAPVAWLDLGILLGASRLSMTGGSDLNAGHVIPVARLNVPPVASFTPYLEAGYGFGVTAVCGGIDHFYGTCDIFGYDKKRNYDGVLLLGGGLRWNASEHWRPTLSIRRVDYTGDPRNECCTFDPTTGTAGPPVGSRRTSTWQLGIGVEWRP